MSQLVDRLIGTRLKASIDRRVRREVGQQHKTLAADLRTQVEGEVSRQLAEAERARNGHAADVKRQVADEIQRCGTSLRSHPGSRTMEGAVSRDLQPDGQNQSGLADAPGLSHSA